MRLIFLLTIFIALGIGAQETSTESFMDYCKQSTGPASNLIDQLKFNFSTSNCERILARIKKSKKVFVYCQKECDASPLAEFADILSLEIINGQLVDISALSGMSSLTKLNLYKNKISDLTSLGGMSALRHLNLRDNKCQKVDQLSNLTDLRELDLAGNRVEDVRSLSGLTKLRILDLSGNKIKDLSPLVTLKRLISVDFKSNPIIKSKKNCPYGRGIPSAISKFCRSYLRKS